MTLSNVTTLTAPFTANTQTGSLIAVYAAAPNDLTVADTLGNTYTLGVSTIAGAAGYLWYTCSGIGGADTVTITQTGGAAPIAVAVVEIQGALTSGCFDANDAGQGGLPTSVTTTGAVAQPTELVLADFWHIDGNISPSAAAGANYTQVRYNVIPGSGSGAYNMFEVYNFSTGLSGTQTATIIPNATSSFGTSVVLIGTFKLATSYSSSVPTFRALTNDDLPQNPVFVGTVQPRTSFTVSTLPTCNAPAANTTTFVTDALAPTYLGTLTGGSSTFTPVVCNGTNWVSY
jgi:hypothetical protein